MPVEVIVELEEGAQPPIYATEGAAGADVRAHLQHEIVLAPGKTALIPTGIRMVIPEGYEVQVRPRSGLAFKHGITLLNSPATIDSDYRGELKILLINHGSEPFTVEPGMRIAQILVSPAPQAQFITGEVVATTVRGAGGFGHTGLS